MADPKLRGSDDDLPSMHKAADDHYPLTPPAGATPAPVDKSVYGGNTAKYATGKPFGTRKPSTDSQRLGQDIGKLGGMLGGIPAGFNALNEALKRKP